MLGQLLIKLGNKEKANEYLENAIMIKEYYLDENN